MALLVARGRGRVSLEEVITQAVDADRLATAALTNALSGEGRSSTAARGAPDDVRRMLQMADARFTYLWSVSHARIVATKGLVRLTLLVSLLVTCYGAYPAFTLEHFDPTVTAYEAWDAAIQVLLARLALGLAVCIALCGVYVSRRPPHSRAGLLAVVPRERPGRAASRTKRSERRRASVDGVSHAECRASFNQSPNASGMERPESAAQWSEPRRRGGPANTMNVRPARFELATFGFGGH